MRSHKTTEYSLVHASCTPPKKPAKNPHPLRQAPRASTGSLLLAALPFEGNLRALLWRYTRNTADTDELLQEVWARLLAPTKTVPTNLLHYVLAIARNIGIDWIRHKAVVPIVLLPDLDTLDLLDPAALAEEVCEFQDEIAQLSAAINTLPPARRRVFILKKVYGHSQAEIAQRLNITANTVEQHLSKGLRGVARALGVSRGMRGKLRERAG
jgi:RNA polymerase sigma factor (sigma-70 family)